MVTPFGPRPAWVRAYLRGGKAADLPHEKAQGTVARCMIAGRTLTVPVEGGAGRLKRAGVNPRLSEHGKWRREHLGAWQAAYGRTPYYTHLMPEIEAVYKRSEGMTLEEFNRALLEVALGWIDIETVRKTVRKTVGEQGIGAVRETGGEQGKEDTLAEVRLETLREVDEELSIFDAIFRLGRRIAFAL